MKMREWGVSSGPAKSGEGRAYSVILSEMPLWWYLIDSAINSFPPRWTYRIKFPDVWKRDWGNEGVEPTSLREYYGSLGSVIMVRANRLYDWAYRRSERYERRVECDGKELKDAVGDIVGFDFFHDV